MNWCDVLPDFGMLYRSPVRTRAEIDALRHLTLGGKIKFTSLEFHTASVPSHESQVIARVDVERLLQHCTPKQRAALRVVLSEVQHKDAGWNKGTLEATMYQAIRKLRKKCGR
jgi:hypothetical protein